MTDATVNLYDDKHKTAQTFWKFCALHLPHRRYSRILIAT